MTIAAIMRCLLAGSTCVTLGALTSVACGGGGTSPSPVSGPRTLKTVNVTGVAPTISGAPQQFVAVAVFSDNTTQAVTSQAIWRSSATSVATVVANSGMVSAVAAGQADISATYNDVSGAFHIVVAPAFTVSGTVTDGTTGYYIYDAVVRATDDLHTGKSASVFSGGLYSIRGVVPGRLTLSVSVVGYGVLEQTTIVTGDTRVDFVLPRIPSSPTAGLAGVWGTRVETAGNAFAAEFTLTQNGSAVTGTWLVPAYKWTGTISGTIGSDRWLRGAMTVTDRECTGAGNISWGDLDPTERFLNLHVIFAGPCGSSGLMFYLFRNCRLVDTRLVCDPISGATSLGFKSPFARR
jgi:hypothetical protein